MKKKGFIDEFKEFIAQGNVIDLAVGVIIGGAFSTIVTSLVDDMLMTLIGMITGGHDISGLAVTFGTATLKYGAFLQAVINFLIIAFCIFMMIKLINKFNKKKETPEEKVEKEEVVLLKEIRDALKNKKK